MSRKRKTLKQLLASVALDLVQIVIAVFLYSNAWIVAAWISPPDPHTMVNAHTAVVFLSVIFGLWGVLSLFSSIKSYLIRQ